MVCHCVQLRRHLGLPIDFALQNLYSNALWKVDEVMYSARAVEKVSSIAFNSLVQIEGVTLNRSWSWQSIDIDIIIGYKVDNIKSMGL